MTRSPVPCGVRQPGRASHHKHDRGDEQKQAPAGAARWKLSTNASHVDAPRESRARRSARIERAPAPASKKQRQRKQRHPEELRARLESSRVSIRARLDLRRGVGRSRASCDAVEGSIEAAARHLGDVLESLLRPACPRPPRVGSPIATVWMTIPLSLRDARRPRPAARSTRRVVAVSQRDDRASPCTVELGRRATDCRGRSHRRRRCAGRPCRPDRLAEERARQRSRSVVKGTSGEGRIAEDDDADTIALPPWPGNRRAPASRRSRRSTVWRRMDR